MAIQGTDNRFVVAEEDLNIFDSAIKSVVAIDKLRSTSSFTATIRLSVMLAMILVL
jgi:hypothetical protein